MNNCGEGLCVFAGNPADYRLRKIETQEIMDREFFPLFV